MEVVSTSFCSGTVGHSERPFKTIGCSLPLPIGSFEVWVVSGISATRCDSEFKSILAGLANLCCQLRDFTTSSWCVFTFTCEDVTVNCGKASKSVSKWHLYSKCNGLGKCGGLLCLQ